MPGVNWIGPQSDLDAKKPVDGVNQKNFDADGLMCCLDQYQNYPRCRKSPHASWNMGPPQEVIIRCAKDVMLSGRMVSTIVDGVETDVWVDGPCPNFVAKTEEETHAVLQDPDKHFMANPAIL